MKILLVEDNPKLNEAIRAYLSDAGFEIEVTFNGVQGVNKIKDAKKENIFYEIVILDRMMPMKDGLEFIKEIKDLSPNIGIIVLTAKDTIEDKVAGLSAGADDYLVKPFDVKELVARLHALYKRVNLAKSFNSEVNCQPGLQSHISTRGLDKSGEFYFNSDLNEVSCHNKKTQLTQKESEIFRLLLSKRMEVVKKDEIFKMVWKENPSEKGADFNPRQIDVHVCNLRNKLIEINFPGLIETIRGIGYKLVFKS